MERWPAAARVFVVHLQIAQFRQRHTRWTKASAQTTRSRRRLSRRWATGPHGGRRHSSGHTHHHRRTADRQRRRLNIPARHRCSAPRRFARAHHRARRARTSAGRPPAHLLYRRARGAHTGRAHRGARVPQTGTHHQRCRRCRSTKPQSRTRTTRTTACLACRLRSARATIPPTTRAPSR